MVTSEAIGSGSIGRQLATFRVEDLWFGLDVSQVHEVLRHQTLTPVPLADVVAGLMNLRGVVVPAVDMRQRLGLPDRPREESLVTVVVRGAEGPIALLVDEIGDVVEADDLSLDDVPGNLASSIRGATVGMYRREGGIVLALSVERLLTIAAPAGQAVPAAAHA